MEKIENLLKEVSKLSENSNELLDKTGARFNIFRITGVNHDENKHSVILAEFLNPKGTHGLKDEFLKSFIDMFGKDDIKNSDSKNARVYTEKSTDSGRMDILIELSNNQAIIIENKVNAGDQEEQLKRYNNDAEKKYGKANYQIIYLTLDGKEASEQSGGDVDYQRISYAKNIINWLEKCLEISVRHPMVHETIKQYINHIKMLTNQSLDMEFEKRVLDEMIKKVDAVYHIANTFDVFKSKIIEVFFNEVADKVGLKVIAEKTSSLNDRSGRVKINSVEKSFEVDICFEFTSSNFKNLAYGFKREKQEEIETDFNKFLIDKLCLGNDSWWYYKKKTNISFYNTDIKEIGNGNYKGLEQFQQCFDCLKELLQLKKEFEEQKNKNQ